MVTAHEPATGASYHVIYTGLIKNVQGTTELVGSINEGTPIADVAASTWNVSVTADDALDSLVVSVTGESAKTINWKAAIKFV